MPERGEELLAVVDGDEADDFKFLLAGGRGNFDFVADLAVEEGFADGGSGGDETLLGVGFFGAHEGVFDFCVALEVQNGEARAVAGAVLRDIGEVQHAEVAHALLEMADLEVDVALAFLGVLVLGVFGEVAVGAGDSGSISSWSFFLILASGSDMVVGFGSLKKSAESGTNGWSPGPRVREHYRCGRIEVTRGSEELLQNCSLHARFAYFRGRNLGAHLD